jgi:hypothetical protein
MSRIDYLPENPNYPQDFKFPDTVNNNLKIKYHYMDATFQATTDQSSFVAEMMNPTSTLLKNYKNVKSVELINAVLHTARITQPILYMFIQEFENVIDSNVASGQGAFTKLFFNILTVDNHAGAKAKIALINENMNPILEWETKGKRIDKMTINFNLFGTTTPLQFANNDIISLTFKIGVIEPLGPR